MGYNIKEKNVTPIYTDFEGWNADLTAKTTYDDFPIELKNYIKFIENTLKVPIKKVTVASDRNQTITT